MLVGLRAQGSIMINYTAYRKFVTLQNGKRVMFRFLNEPDREELIRLIHAGVDGIGTSRPDLVRAIADELK